MGKRRKSADIVASAGPRGSRTESVALGPKREKTLRTPGPRAQDSKTARKPPHQPQRTLHSIHACPSALKRLQATAAGAEQLWKEAVSARTPVRGHIPCSHAQWRVQTPQKYRHLLAAAGSH